MCLPKPKGSAPQILRVLHRNRVGEIIMPLRGEETVFQGIQGPHPGAKSPEDSLTQQPGLSPQTCSLSPTVSRPSGAPSPTASSTSASGRHSRLPAVHDGGWLTDPSNSEALLPGAALNVSRNAAVELARRHIGKGRPRYPSPPPAPRRATTGRHCAAPLTCPSGSVPLFRVRQVESVAAVPFS